MARRYRAILDHLGHTHCGFDLSGGKPLNEAELESSDAIIIATPTQQHLADLNLVAKLGKPILCEKPISTDFHAVEQFLKDNPRLNLQMISQYDHLIDPTYSGITIYDYYNHGKDGLPWDCINIIYHAKEEIRLAEKSPLWRCVINGLHLDLRAMDLAYIAMIKEWLEEINPDVEAKLKRIFIAHKKVYELYYAGK